MKYLLFAILIIFTITTFSPAIMAQDPTAEPTVQPTIEPTAEPTPEPPGEPTPPTVEGIKEQIAWLIAAFGGVLGTILTNVIKGLPGISEGDKSKLQGALAAIVAVVVSSVTGYVLAAIGAGLDWIGDSQLQMVAISILAVLVSKASWFLDKVGSGMAVKFSTKA